MISLIFTLKGEEMGLFRLEPKEEKTPLHQEVCDLYGITRFELANKLGFTKATLDTWSDESRMTKVTHLALELMVENYHQTKLLSDFSDLMSKINTFSTQNIYSLAKENGDQVALVNRIKYVLEEYNINTIVASEKLNEPSFEKLRKILNLQTTPDFDFLDKFSNTFAINKEWLKTGKWHPFDTDFIKNHNLIDLSEKIQSFEKIFIIHSSDNKTHTEVVVKDRNGNFSLLRQSFCIGENFEMSGVECCELYELYKFYIKHKYDISLIVIEHEDYNKLVSADHYIGNIIKRSKPSYMLDDLFDLRYLNKDIYGDFFVECTDIIKSMKESEEKRAQKEKKC